jgi:hypothetical protein
MAVQPRPQPFKYHPHPGLFGAHTLAANNIILPSVVQDDGDVLLVAPAPLSPNGRTERLLFAAVARVTEQPQSEGPTPLNAGDVQLVIKTIDGREAIVGQNSGGENVDDRIDLGQVAIVCDADLGYFLRITAPDVAVNCVGPFAEMRGMEILAVDIVDVYPNMTLLYTQNEFGRVQVPSVAGLGFGSVPGAVQNFDDIAHSFRWFVSDGTNTFEYTNSLIPCDPGIVDVPHTDPFAFPVLPAGWSAYVALDTDGVSTKAPRVVTGMQPCNAAARSDQAGAY